MDNTNLIEKYDQQINCITYKDELYSVRDNGSILRHKPNGNSKPRPLDEKWTFGNKNKKNGYMTIGDHRVHIIVATAFYGKNDSKKMVVDHIDTNRCNNRAENLRWVTKLENALMNPITRKKIEYLCDGDITKFLKDPSCLRNLDNNQNLMWMRTVSAEEAQNAYANALKWANESEKKQRSGSLGEWIYNKPKRYKSNKERNARIHLSRKKYEISQSSTQNDKQYNTLMHQRNEISQSLTPNGRQRNWKTPTIFPLCPTEITKRPLYDYASNLEIGKVISQNKYSTSYVDEFEICGDKLFVRAHSNSEIKPYCIITISFENGYYVHEGATFFEEQGAQKVLAIDTGKEWTGGSGIDDYC